MRHRCDVRLRQEIAGEICVEVEALQAGYACGGAAAASRKPVGDERADLGARVLGPEVTTLVERQHLH